MSKTSFYLYQLDSEFPAERSLPVMACPEFGERSIDNPLWAQNAWVRSSPPGEDSLPAVVRPQDTLPPQYCEPITRNFVVALGAPLWSYLPSKEDLPNNPPVQEAFRVTHTTPHRPRTETETREAALLTDGSSGRTADMRPSPPRKSKPSKQPTQSPTSTPPNINFETIEDANEFLRRHKGRGRPSNVDRTKTAVALAMMRDAKLSK